MVPSFTRLSNDQCTIGRGQFLTTKDATAEPLTYPVLFAVLDILHLLPDDLMMRSSVSKMACLRFSGCMLSALWWIQGFIASLLLLLVVSYR